MKSNLPVVLAIRFAILILSATLLSMPAIAQAGPYDMSGLEPARSDRLQPGGNPPQRNSSGASGQQLGYRTGTTQQGAIANRQLHNYRNTTKSQIPGGNGLFRALQPARTAGLAGVFGYDDGGLGADRSAGWTPPYTPSSIPTPSYTDYQPSPLANGDSVGAADYTGGDGLQALHDGTPYDGQMMLSDCGGYIGYVPNDFQGSMEDWWRSPYCAYQITPDRPANIHYRSWLAQGSPPLF